MIELLKEPSVLDIAIKVSSVLFLSIIGMIINHSVRQFVKKEEFYKKEVDLHSKLLDRLTDLTERHSDYLKETSSDIKELNSRVNQINSLGEKVAVLGEKIGELNRVIDKLTDEFRVKYATKDELKMMSEKKK